MSGPLVPTPEQADALRLFGTGDDLVLEACAGSGKTATLKMLAESTPRRGRYMAFNRALVNEAQAKMPRNVAVATAHSVAFRAYGKRYARRLNGPRIRSYEIARMLNLRPLSVRYGAATKVIQPGKLASIVMQAMNNYAQSADESPLPRHVPYLDGIDGFDSKGKREYRNQEVVRAYLAPFLIRAWADLASPDGGLRYNHDYYFKSWALTHPRAATDFILLDEAQDTAPVLAALLSEQTHCQRVAVGDSNQAIYGWRGAIDAMAMFPDAPRATLSRSFRFGPAIAEVANLILDNLPTEMVVSGTAEIGSSIGELVLPDAILTRTNAGAMRETLDALRSGLKPHIVGGGRELASFARGADELRDEGWTSHPELSCFDSWTAVLDYVEQDPSGGELKLLVSLVEDFGTETILDTLDGMVPESAADVVVSTVHKAKGREWDRVRIGDDYTEEPDEEEWRLLYVAVTRARKVLDDTTIRPLYSSDDEADTDEPEEGAA